MKSKNFVAIAMIAFVTFALGLAATAVYNAEFGEASRMPANFSLEDSRAAIDRALPGNCENTLNHTRTNEYVFECRQEVGNFTYVSQGRVAYNATGPDRVYVFD